MTVNRLIVKTNCTTLMLFKKFLILKHNKVKFNILKTVVPHSLFHKFTPLQCVNTWPPFKIGYIKITLHLTHGSLGRDLSTFSSTSSLSKSNATFETGLSTMLFLSPWLTLPIFNLTLHTSLFSSQYVSMTLHICQSFLCLVALGHPI